MKLRKTHLAALFAVPVLTLAAGAALQEGGVEIPSKEELQARAMALMTPGPEHEQLARWVGEWDAEVKIWMSPDGEPMVSSNKTTARMILGGRFLQSEASGEFMGMTVESMGIMGFDRRSEEFTTVGFDTLGTYYVTAKGTYDEETKTLTMRGEDYDAALGHTQEYEFAFTWIDDDHYTMALTFFDEITTQGQGPFKMVEIHYTRAN